ncbi:MAG: domain containing protein [Acidobacteria bacterium]|nr:domain containing protein [Acidobacteriota bacterium]
MNLRPHRFYLSCLFVLFTAGSAFAQFVDVGVSKSGPSTAAGGTDVSYDVLVFNSGSDDAAMVTLDDPIPIGMTFVSAIQNSGVPFTCSTPTVGATSGSVNCSAALLMSGENADFTITLHIPAGATAGTTFLNVATVTTTSGDGNSENDSSGAGTTIPSTAADVGVNKSGPSAAPPGGNVSYTITVANGSLNDAQTVSLADTLPGTMTFVSLTQSGQVFTCTIPSAGSGGTISCSIATLPAGASTTFTLTGNIPGGTAAGTTFVNTADIKSSDDQNPENDSSSSTLTVSSVDLSATKSGPATATSGQDVTYDIGIANGGPNTAFNATITDPLPSGTTFVSLTQNTGPSGSCAVPFTGFTGTVQCTFPTSMTSGTSATFTLVIHVGLGVANGSTLTNTASVSSDGFDSNPANDSASTSAAVTAFADMGVTKSGPATVVAGTNASYTITVTNSGPSDATGAQLTDTLPALTTFVSLAQNSGPSAVCTMPAVGGTGTVTCSWSSLVNGATAAFTLTLKSDPTTPAGPLTNTASVTTTANDPNAGNDSSGSTATIVLTDVGIVKSIPPGLYIAGQPITFTLDVTNNGVQTAAGIVVTDTLPAGMTFISATPPGACSGTTTVTCNAATLASGATTTFTITATLPATAGPVTNSASVTTATGDSFPANNSSSLTFTVIPITAIPTLSPLMMALIALAFTAIAVRAGRT